MKEVGEIVQQQLTGVYSSAGPPKTTDKAEKEGGKYLCC
jgi:hypothetical protein